MREAITIQDNPVNERQAQPEDAKQTEFTTIDTTDIDEEGFLKAAIDAIGSVTKAADKTLDKDTFIKVFKYTGDFAKFKNTELKKEAQTKRCGFFNEDPQKYLVALKTNI